MKIIRSYNRSVLKKNKIFCVRVDENLYKKARKLRLPIADIMRLALIAAVAKNRSYRNK